MKLFLIICTLFSTVALAQDKIVYNWKGNGLEVFEKPDIKSNRIATVPVNQKLKIIQTISEKIFPIYLSYYGDTVTTKVDEFANNEKHVYTMQSPWVKIEWNGIQGFVPEPFLSHVQPLQITKSEDSPDTVNFFLKGLTTYFGKPVSYKKTEFEKQTPDEIHNEQFYQFSNKVRYKFIQQYFEEGGPGGEDHILFLPGFRLHEAILFALQITDAYSYPPENLHSYNLLKSSYDYFYWWHQPYTTNDDGIRMLIANNEYHFRLAMEGGSSNISFIIKDGGVEVQYGFGGC